MAKVEHTCTGCVPIDASIIDVYVTLVETNKSVTNAEAGRTEAEAARVVAETQRTATFTTDHNRSVADHSIAQSDHATAGTDHTSTVAATESANAAAALANEKAELVQERLNTADDDHSRAETDHILAGTDHSTATADHTRASADHTQAGTDHYTATTDHTRAENDHATAASDHTASVSATAAANAAAELANAKAGLVQEKLDRADTDHTRAESDHSTAYLDHTTSTADHTRASSDHTQAGTDHTRAQSDHSTAYDDHALAEIDHGTAGTDHTRAENDHATAASDHTASVSATAAANAAADLANTKAGLVQDRLDTADADHTRAEADHTTAGADHTTAQSDHSTAASDHTTAAADHTTAGADHTQALADHAIAENDHATLDERIAHKADIDGSYDGMAVGIARNLEGRTDVTDSFFERTTGGDAEVANGTAQLNEVKGKSQVWNQLVGDDTESVVVVNGHKYLSVIGGVKAIGESDGNAIAVTGGTDMVIDLTLIFGVGNEPATVEEFEAWLAENIGEQAYYPYNAGEVLNNRMTGVESIGFNLLDPATGKADIIGAYSDVYGNYYGITGTHGALTFTDKFGNTETITPDEDGKFLLEMAGTLSVADAGEDCAVFLWWDGTQTEYKPYEKNVGALDVTHIYGKLNGEGEYVRVWPTGMPGIGDIKDSLKVVDGQVVAERKIAEVDMGTLTYSMFGDGNFYANVVDKSNRNNLVNVICGKYPSNSVNSSNASILQMMANRTIAGYYNPSSQNSLVYVKDEDYTDEASLKTSLNGVPLYYELATPRIYTDLIYRDSEAFADNTPVTLPVNYKVDNCGIERIAPQNTEEAVLTAKPELTMRYSIDAVEELNTHRDEIEDLYEKNEELDERKPEKYGEYPDMAVGSAKNLAGQDTKVEDFVFKAIDCADGLAKLNSAIGKSLVWNQLVQNGNFANGTTGWEFVGQSSGDMYVVDNTMTFTFTQTNGRLKTSYTSLVVGHKYACFADVKPTTERVVDFEITFGWQKINKICPAGQTTQLRGILTATDSYTSSSYIQLFTSSAIEEEEQITFSNVMLIDLTLMFGAGNEPATVEEFEAMFPLPYYDYNPGEIISNKTEGVKVAGFNQWDEEWVNGLIDAQTGEFVPNTTNICAKNHIKVLPNTDYYAVSKAQISNGNFRIRFYDAAKQYLGTDATFSGNNLSFRTPSNARYMLFYMFLQYGNTYRNDICINLSDPARNGTYEPYKTNTIELNLPTLTGKLNGEGESVVVFPDGLKSAGSVYDEIVGNKAIKRVGSVDLNTLSWQAGGSSNQLWAAFLGNNPDHALSTNGIAEKYMVVNQLANTLDVDNTISLTENATRVYVYHSASEPTGILYYELATPEEYILDAPLPNTFQAYKGGTIKQLPENGSAPVTAPMVMEVVYSLDAVGILTGLPKNYISLESLQAMLNAMQSAGLFTSYTLTWYESQGKYKFTFQANQ